MENTRIEIFHNLYKDKIKNNTKHFRRVDLSNLKMSNLDLRDFDFQDANLEGASLENCDLRNANFMNANLEGCSFFAALLDGATMMGAHVSDKTKFSSNFHRAGKYIIIDNKIGLKDVNGLIAALLKKRRVDLGITQGQLCSSLAIDFSSMQLSYNEKDTPEGRAKIRLETLFYISQALKISIFDFIPDELCGTSYNKPIQENTIDISIHY